jgi:hypothetical protein
MTNKITLLSEQPLALNSMWLSDVIAPHLMLEYYDTNKTYNKQSTVFYAPYHRGRPATPIQQQFLEDGFKIAYDNLWEAPVVDVSKYVIQCRDWFRHYESLWYRYLGYNTYQPNKNFTKLAFMPMRLAKPHRDLAAKKLQPWLDDFVWSYVDQGRQLPNGGDAVNDWNVQRLFRPEWYDDTCFSFVSETQVQSTVGMRFITEKTYKPIAFYHPFVIMGMPGTLKSLKSQGFETFENLFDESYDAEHNWYARLDCLIKNVSEFKKQPYDMLTQQKVQHNHALFFDHAASCKYIIEQIVEPLLNYAET